MEKFSALIIGLGKMGSAYAFDPKSRRNFKYLSHAQTLAAHRGFRLGAAVDADEPTLTAAARHWKIPAAYTNLAALGKDGTYDIAVIATPPQGRLELLKSLPPVRAVVIEKPLANSFDEAQRIVDHCAERNILLQVNYWRRFDEKIRKLAQTRQKAIGDLQAGFGLYGNGLLNNGSHLIDMARLFCGEIDGVERAVRGRTDTGFTLAAGGAEIHVDALDFSAYREIYLDLWGSQGRLEILQESLCYRLSGTAPHRTISGDVREPALLRAADGKTGAGTALYNLYSNLHAALRGKESLLSDGTNALRNEAVIHQIETLAGRRAA